jgi:hypothetical protein
MLKDFLLYQTGEQANDRMVFIFPAAVVHLEEQNRWEALPAHFLKYLCKKI